MHIIRASAQQNQSVPLSELEKINKMNDINIKAMQTQINNVKNELRSEMQNSIQASMSNQTNELKNMMASFFQMNTASTSGTGSLPSNTVANPKGELKAITTRSGLVLDGPTVPMPPPFINPEEDERVEETLTDPEHGEYTIKVPPPQVQKAKPPSQRNFVIHQRDPRYPHIPYPSRMNQEKQKEKDEEKLIELANTPLNENCSAVILKKLHEKLGDPGKFLIPYGFSERKCKALADLGVSINLMPLSVWEELGLPKLISTQMTLELANRDICTPKGIARDVFVPVGKFTFPADFVIVDYESDPLVLNMRNDTSSYSNEPHQESINMIDVYNVSREEIREDLFATNHPSGNPTSSLTSHTNSLENSNPSSLLPPFHNSLSGSTTSSLPSLHISETSDYCLEEFADELAHITFPPENDDLPFDAESELLEIKQSLEASPGSIKALTHTQIKGKFDEDLLAYYVENGIFKDFQDTSESSNDNTNVVNALREPFVVNQDPGEKSSQGAHFGYNCPPKDPIISKPEPCNQTIKLPQTLPSLDPSCFSLPHVSKPNLVDDPPNVFNLYPQILPIVQPICNYENGNSFTYDSKPHSFNVSSSVFNQPQQPQFETYLCELCGNNAHYGYDCSPQFPFVYEPEPCYNQNFNDNYYP
ncbi:reverse transcriptase domain-containing protein [Tanacetum coccineum]